MEACIPPMTCEGRWFVVDLMIVFGNLFPLSIVAVMQLRHRMSAFCNSTG